MARLSDGTRKVMQIGEVTGVEDDQVQMQDIFEFERTGISPRGKVLGKFKGNGVTPVCIERLQGVRRASLAVDFQRSSTR